MFMHSYTRPYKYVVNQLFRASRGPPRYSSTADSGRRGGGGGRRCGDFEQPEAGPVAGGLRPEGSAAGRYHKIMAEDLKEGSQSRVGGSQQNRTRPRAIGMVTPVLNSLAWPRIDALVARRDVTKVWRLLRTDGVPPNVRELLVFRSSVSARETPGTDGGDLHLQRCRLSSTQRSFSYRAMLYCVSLF